MRERYVDPGPMIETLEKLWLWNVHHSRKGTETDQELFAQFLADHRTDFALRTLEQSMLREHRNRAESDPKGNILRDLTELSPVQWQLWLIWQTAQRRPVLALG